MEFETYQEQAKETAIYPREKGLEYLVLGITSEVGELAGKIKKVMRDGGGYDGSIADELGDILWYLMMLARHFNYSGDYIAERNLAKLGSRAARGTIGGSGDDR